jgi:hypothetical protein
MPDSGTADFGCTPFSKQMEFPEIDFDEYTGAAATRIVLPGGAHGTEIEILVALPA